MGEYQFCLGHQDAALDGDLVKEGVGMGERGGDASCQDSSGCFFAAGRPEGEALI